MQFLVERIHLIKGLSHACSVIEPRTTIPILSHVLLDVQGSELKLTGSSADLEIVETVEAEVVTSGRVAAPARTLLEIARKLPDGAQASFSYEPEKKQLRITSGRIDYSLSCLDAEDFPRMDSSEWGSQFSLTAADLSNLVSSTLFAASNDEIRYYLNGVYVHASGVGEDDSKSPMLRMVATDGHRLALAQVPLPPHAEGLEGMILPKKAVADLRALMEDDADDVRIHTGPGRVRFCIGSSELTTRLIEASYPNYSKVIPVDNEIAVIVPVKPFLDAVERISLVSEDKARGVKLSLASGLMTVMAVGMQNRGEEKVEIDYTGEAMEISLTSKFIVDILSTISTEVCIIKVAHPSSPVLVTPQEEDDTLFVIMPLRNT